MVNLKYKKFINFKVPNLPKLAQNKNMTKDFNKRTLLGSALHLFISRDFMIQATCHPRVAHLPM